METVEVVAEQLKHRINKQSIVMVRTSIALTVSLGFNVLLKERIAGRRHDAFMTAVGRCP